MPKSDQKHAEDRLRRKLNAFLAQDGERAAISAVLSDWHRKAWRPYLFGGLLRDIFIFGARKYPRDIDVVLVDGNTKAFERTLEPHIIRRTRFGGLQLELEQWHFDVWPIKMTWAFRQNKNLCAIPVNLPRTTFLNVEAVVAEIGENGRIHDIIESGFFQAIYSKLLDINFEENPYPALAAARALATAAKLRFAMTARLAGYIVDVEKEFGTHALVAAQDSHYGSVRFRPDDIQCLICYLRRSISRKSNKTIFLPENNIVQLPLWG
jgi:hypothetical protein